MVMIEGAICVLGLREGQSCREVGERKAAGLLGGSRATEKW